MTIIDENTQVTDLCKLDLSKIVFEKPIVNKDYGNYRIPIKVKNDDGTTGSLLVKTERLFSFGISNSEYIKKGSNAVSDPNKVKKYSFSICLWNSDEDKRTEREQLWTSQLDRVALLAAKHAFIIRSQLGDNEDEDERYFSKKACPLFWSKDPLTNKPSKDKGPVLYTKLIQKGNGTILTTFVNNRTGEDIEDPVKELMDTRCNATSYILIESMFIGQTSRKLQVKLYETYVTVNSKSLKRFGAGQVKKERLLATVNPLDDEKESESDDTNAGSEIEGSDC